MHSYIRKVLEWGVLLTPCVIILGLLAAPFLINQHLSDDWVVYSGIIFDKAAIVILLAMLVFGSSAKQRFQKGLLFVMMVVSSLLLLNFLVSIVLPDYEIITNYWEIADG